ncbi:Fibrobacter succinogenes major domain (Fib_succ_major) [Elizabethkingia miricola]|nr:Fibrobacter succinogenes major domain (Fib_succ_major) [Elizabethkingia miricola]
MVNFNFRKMAGLTVASFFLCVTSCRTSDTDNNLANSGPATVKINFKGDAYDEDTDPKAATRSMVAEKTTVMLDPSTYVNIEVAPDNTPKTRTTREVKPLDNSALRVIAYEAGTKKYKDHKDYVIMWGNVYGDALELDGGTPYAIVAYSYGSTANLPAFTDADKSKLLSQVVLDYDYTDPKYRDFMWFKQEGFIPKGGENNFLSILLKHKVAAITATLKIDGKNIEKVENVSISPNKQNATVSLETGTFSNVSGDVASDSSDIKFNTGTSTASTVAGTQVLVNYDSNGTKDGKFGADVTIDGTKKRIDTKEGFFYIKRGIKRNITLNFKVTAGKCKIKISKTELREFECYNVGADTTADPFIGSAEIQGAKFKWGAAIGELGNYLSQASDLKYSNNPGTQEDFRWYSGGKSDPDGWSTSGGPNNPCSPGFRIPTQSEWAGVHFYASGGVAVQNNHVEKLGEWNGNSYPTTKGFLYTDRDNKENKMFLPLAGLRDGLTGNSGYRGTHGYYWTSEKYYSVSHDQTLYADLHGEPTGALSNAERYHGMSVRCIKG